MRGGSALASKCGASWPLFAGLVALLSAIPQVTASALPLHAGDLVVSGTVEVTGVGGSFQEGLVVRIEPATGRQDVIAFGGLLADPVGLAVDAAGTLYALDGDRVIAIDAASGGQHLLSEGGRLIDATDLTLTGDGRLLVLTNPREHHRHPDIVEILRTDGTERLVAELEGSLGTATAIASSPSLDFAVLNPVGCGGACLSMTRSDGSFRTAWIGSPTDLAVAPDETVFVSLVAFGYLVPPYEDNGYGPALLTWRGTTGLDLLWLDALPLAIEFALDGELYGAFDGHVGRIDLATGAVTNISSGGLLGSFAVRDIAVVPAPGVPEPSAALVFAAGTVVAGWAAHRRRR